MFEFKKLCNEFEKLTPAERGVLLTETSVSVIKRLKELSDDDPVDTLAAFIIGSVVSDGSVSEKDYLFIHPSLVKAFGEACDLAGIKHSYKVSKDVRKQISEYTKILIKIISAADEELEKDIITLCLLVTSVDGKISLKEQQYIKQLCRA